MKCNHCWAENPKGSKFCRKCGTPLGVFLRCPRCGSENPGDSTFCTKCGESLSGAKRPFKGTRRKCRNCGHFNELDAQFCVGCGEEITEAPKGGLKRPSADPSFRTVAIVIALIFLFSLLIKLGTTFFKGEKPSRAAVSAPISTVSDVDNAQVLAVAKNFKCACGGCGELSLETCNCDMPKGSVEEKNFIRGKLAEGLTIEQVIEALDKRYGHRV